MFIVSSRRTVTKRPGGGIPGPVLAALSAPGRPRPSRTPAAGNGAAWNERGARRFLNGRLAGPVGGGPRGRAAGSPAAYPLPCPHRAVTRPRPSAQVPVAGQSPVPDRLPRRPPPPAARPRRHGRRPVADNPPRCWTITGPLPRYFSSSFNSGQLD